MPATNYAIFVAAETVIGLGEIISADIQSGVPPGKCELNFSCICS